MLYRNINTLWNMVRTLGFDGFFFIVWKYFTNIVLVKKTSTYIENKTTWISDFLTQMYVFIF